MSQETSSADPDSCIWQAAADLIGRHGIDAPLYAEQSFDLSIERGDFRSAARWRRVHDAIAELLREPASRCPSC